MSKYTAVITSAAQGGARNPANVTFSFTDAGSQDPGDAAACAMRVMAYLIASGVMGGGTSIERIYRSPEAGGAAQEVPWPAGNWSLAAGGLNRDPNQSSYPVAIGSGAYAPVGTSIAVSEYTAGGGRTGRGRHYLPFIKADVIDGNGFLSPSAQAAVADAWATYIVDEGQVSPGLGPAGIKPSVYSKKENVQRETLAITVSPTPANLRSRRR